MAAAATVGSTGLHLGRPGGRLLVRITLLLRPGRGQYLTGGVEPLPWGPRCQATFLYHNHDHPVWLMGSRAQVPQPGSYTHMHWLTEGADHDGTFLSSSIEQVEAFFGVDIVVPPECNVARASELTPGVACPGFILQVRATETFAFHHGGEDIPVGPGIDNRTHFNLVSSIPAAGPGH